MTLTAMTDDSSSATLSVFTDDGTGPIAAKPTPLDRLSRKTPQVATAVLPPMTGTDRRILMQLSAGTQILQQQTLSARLWHGTAVTAIAQDQLQAAALHADLAAGRITRQDYALAAAAANGVTTTLTAPKTPHRSNVTNPNLITMAGTVSYHDINNTVQPVRNTRVYVIPSGVAPPVAQGKTDESGNFSLSFDPTPLFGTTPASPAAYYVEVDTTNGVDQVIASDGSAYATYSQPQTLGPGATAQNSLIDIPNTTTLGRAFALLDPLQVAGDYYQKIRQSSWVTGLTAHYPNPASGSYENSSDHSLWFSSSLVSIGTPPTPCTEYAFTWDVVGHESGQPGRPGEISPPGSHRIRT